MKAQWFLIPAFALITVSCSETPESSSPPPPPPTSPAETITLEGKTIQVFPKKLPPTLRDVAYGPHERNKLDFWKAESAEPTPLVFYIHGGGWKGGSKEENKGPTLALLDKGVSYVSINYRLADSDDPVARQSTRILGAAAIKAQTTIEPLLVDKRLGPTASGHAMIWMTVGASSREEILGNVEKYRELAVLCSPLTHVTPDDPPVMIDYDADTPAPPERDGIHHAEFGRILKEKAEPLGLICKITFHGGEGREAALDAFMMELFQKHAAR